MELLSLYDEILYKIILSIHDPTWDPTKRRTDRINLFNILITCTRLRDISRRYWNEIVDYYTIKLYDVLGDTAYYFCEHLHRSNDRPALILDATMHTRGGIYPSSVWNWYQYGRLHRDNLPAVVDERRQCGKYYRRGYIVSIQTLPSELIDDAKSLE